MRVKLTVVHTERGGAARTYVLDQDRIVIGRASTCDLPLDDPDIVVSKRHAELAVEGGALHLQDLGSKNHSFVNGARVGAGGVAVRPGDAIQLGPFEITVGVEPDAAPAVDEDADRTVFAPAFANPFDEPAAAVAAAIAALRGAFETTDYRHRSEALGDALRGALGDGGGALVALVDPDAAPLPEASPAPLAEPDALPLARATPITPPPPLAPSGDDLPPPGSDALDSASLDELFGPPIDAAGASPADERAAPREDRASDDPFALPPGLVPSADAAPPPALAPFAEPPAAPPPADVPDALHRALATAVTRLVSIPGTFRHEFLGHTVVHAPESAFLFDADADALLRHLMPDDPSLQADRFRILQEATEAVLHHHQSLLEGYRAAAREGAEVLVDGLDPDKIGDQAKPGGLLQGRESAILDLVRERCAMMRGEDFAAAERRVYRPAFSRAYLDALAYARASLSTP